MLFLVLCPSFFFRSKMRREKKNPGLRRSVSKLGYGQGRFPLVVFLFIVGFAFWMENTAQNLS